MEVTVYSKNNCMNCLMTKKIMTSEGIDYKEINIDNEEENLANGLKTREEYINYLKNEIGLSAMPIVVLDTGVSWGGFRPDKIKAIKNT